MSNEDGSSPAFPHDANPGVHGPGYGISERAYAAIHLRVPDSGLPWLDEMIERGGGMSLSATVFICVPQRPCSRRGGRDDFRRVYLCPLR